jgi:hypothetical protein
MAGWRLTLRKRGNFFPHALRSGKRVRRIRVGDTSRYLLLRLAISSHGTELATANLRFGIARSLSLG